MRTAWDMLIPCIQSLEAALYKACWFRACLYLFASWFFGFSLTIWSLFGALCDSGWLSGEMHEVPFCMAFEFGSPTESPTASICTPGICGSAGRPTAGPTCGSALRDGMDRRILVMNLIPSYLKSLAGKTIWTFLWHSHQLISTEVGSEIPYDKSSSSCAAWCMSKGYWPRFTLKQDNP